jgi:dCTP deaminase
MILLHDQLVAAMGRQEVSDRLIITPLLDPEKQVGPGSVDLRLGTEFLEVLRRRETIVDPFADGESDDKDLQSVDREDRTYVPLGDAFVLHPGQFVLGCTLEYMRLPSDIGGQVLSRSSWGRMGLLVATAVAVQPGFRGVLTLELVNTGNVPLRLRPGLRVAQLQLWSAEAGSGSTYGADGKYQASLGPQGNRLAWEQPEKSRLQAISDRLHGRTADGH